MEIISTFLKSLLLSILSVSICAQKKAYNVFKLRKTYEFLNEEKDEAKAFVKQRLWKNQDIAKAHIVMNQKAFLLGQSVMERFCAITIDNQNNKLIIKR